MTTSAAIGYSSEFHIWDSTLGTPAFVKISEVTSITPPNEQIDIIDVTHMDSPSNYREFIQGLTDPGECGFEMNFVPGSASEDLVLAVKAGGVAVQCKVVFPNAATWTFAAFVTGYEPAVPVDDKMTATVTMKVTGSVVRA